MMEKAAWNVWDGHRGRFLSSVWERLSWKGNEGRECRQTLSWGKDNSFACKGPQVQSMISPHKGSELTCVGKHPVSAWKQGENHRASPKVCELTMAAIQPRKTIACSSSICVSVSKARMSNILFFWCQAFQETAEISGIRILLRRERIKCDSLKNKLSTLFLRSWMQQQVFCEPHETSLALMLVKG